VDGLQRDVLRASVNKDAGALELYVTAQDDSLAYDVASRVLRQLVRYSRDVRVTRARSERLFLEGRRAEAERGLEEAERELASFLSGNRIVEGSPTLTLTSDRLRRKVEFRLQALVGVDQAFERARASEVRSEPALTVVQPPQVPPRSDGQPFFLALVVGGVLAVGARCAQLVLREKRA
jgi:uncharacterized protein involved in exopolysaccharide biosynthesis